MLLYISINLTFLINMIYLSFSSKPILFGIVSVALSSFLFVMLTIKYSMLFSFFRSLLIFSLVFFVKSILMIGLDLFPKNAYVGIVGLVLSMTLVLFFDVMFKSMKNRATLLFGNLYDKIFKKDETISQELSKNLEDMDGKEFEEYIAKIYRANGYNAKTTTQLRSENDLPQEIMASAGSGEQGVDVIVFLENPIECSVTKESFDGIIVQCKKYSNTVGNSAIQEIYSARPIYEKHFLRKFKMVAVTNNFYTKQAQILAANNKVQLIDGDGLKSLVDDTMKMYNQLSAA